ncbi:tyrosine phosphatase [Plakobranchus ocellatus]|uniref:Tyrosine phosphatase n=1 Tax=Plakobranchus ocellatus TaxID=259542 RepID=A0AAV4BV84_9GAST|nr:tyrosine phosphatase [Plakobranchus ocellatus]
MGTYISKLYYPYQVGDVNTGGRLDCTRPHNARFFGQTEVFVGNFFRNQAGREYFKADVNITTEDSITALMIACLEGNIGIVNNLLQHNPQIVSNIPEHGITALMVACAKGYEKVVKTLLEHNAEINTIDNLGHTALMYACLNGHEDTVSVLVQDNDAVDVKDNTGQTALMYACKGGFSACVKILLNKNATVTIENEDGFTCLEYASFYGHTDIVQLLLHHGNAKNVSAKSIAMALSIASRLKKREIEQILRDHGAVDSWKLGRDNLDTPTANESGISGGSAIQDIGGATGGFTDDTKQTNLKPTDKRLHLDSAVSSKLREFDAFLRELKETFKSNPPSIQVNGLENLNIQQATNVATEGNIIIQGQQGHYEGHDEESTEEEIAEQESVDDT